MDIFKYWKKKEQEYERRWAKKMSASPIVWISRTEFWKIFIEKYQKNNKELAKDIEFHITLEALRARIKEPPVFTPLEEDFPGPVERWYGKVENNIFILTYYHSSFKESSLIRLEDNKDIEKVVLNALKKFKELNPY